MSTYSYIYNPKSWLLHFYKCGLLHFKFQMSTYSYILTLKCQVTFTDQIPNINFYTSNRKCQLPFTFQVPKVGFYISTPKCQMSNVDLKQMSTSFYFPSSKCWLWLPISSQIGLIHCHATSQSILIGNNLTRVNKSPIQNIQQKLFSFFLN
jgi:hypothetical protein